MSNILNISSKNSYLTSKQWEEVVEYVKNRKTVSEDVVIEEEANNVIEEVVKESNVIMFATRSVSNTIESQALSGTVLSSSGGTLTSGEYYLNADTTIAKDIEIPSSSNVVIDLNGHVLSTSAKFISTIRAGGSLTIKDSNPDNSHYGTVTNGIWHYNSSATTGVEIKGGIITGGTGDRGGALLTSGTLILNGGSIAGCVAQETDPDQTDELHIITGGAGGAVYIQADANGAGEFIMNGGSIKYCSSDPDISSLGGAVFVDCEGSNSGLFIMNGGKIEHCTSTSGGAVYVHKSLAEGATALGIFEMTGGEISNNISKGSGGGIHVTGKFVMSGGKICNNKTLDTGILLDGIPSYKFYGGGIHAVGNSAIVIMDDGEISDNAAASGGGVMVYTGASFTMNGGTIARNIACGDGGLGNGGAVYVHQGTFNFNKGVLENNYARRYGGAININQTATMNLNGECKILNNSANHGGGISQEAGDCQIELTNENILISGNIARTVDYDDGAGGGGAGNGGGLFIEKGVLNFSAGTITGNTATGRGGGLSMCVKRIGGDIAVNMTGGNITNNNANETGGGIDIFADYKDDTSIDNHVEVSLYGGLIDCNTSDSDGGGIQVWVNEENSELSLYIGKQELDTEPTITNNYSGVNGGAIGISSGNVIMRKGILHNNSAKNNGGSIYINGGNFTMTNGSFDNNTSELSGGAVYLNNGNVNIESGTISNNIALDSGGAIAVTSGNVTIGIEECYNAGDSSTHSHPIIEGNIASDGGGIYVDGGVTTMWCGDIKQNLTHEKTVNVLVISGGNFVYNGGTIGIPYDSGVFVNGGVFEDNSSESESVLKHELHYHSVLGDEIYNGRIPESKWIASPRGDVINVTDYDSSAVTWADLFPNYEFVGWESKSENDTDEVVNLYAIWEKR